MMQKNNIQESCSHESMSKIFLSHFFISLVHESYNEETLFCKLLIDMFDMSVQSMSRFQKYLEEDSSVITHLHSSLHKLVGTNRT
jgi:hypothetical protein